jgi:ATP-dependent helicase/nuclease subunit A
MTVLPFPTRGLNDDPQRIAADPGISAFVTANAGSGKTKTLIDRVARLLLAGAKPATILCVTYTKAAAAEMQRRLFQLLGDWSVLPDEELRVRLEALQGPDPKLDFRRARSLFAQALETPGGLKIQTIHAFCEKLLRRFPLEAGVSPDFRVMDDAAAAAVAAAARAAIARHALRREDRISDAYARMSVALAFPVFQQMFLDFESRRGRLAAFFEAQGGYDGAQAWVWETCGATPGRDEQAVERDAMAALDRPALRLAAEVLSGGGKGDQALAGELSALAGDPQASLDRALAPFFTDAGVGTPKTWPTKAAAFRAHEALRARLLAVQEHLEAARADRRGVRIAADTLDALVLAEAYLNAYAIEKRAAGALDFADLIEKTHALLSRRATAAWVLFKLDGGVDHILLDEAQDTARDQWDILGALTEEFFAGAGRPRDPDALRRNVFVVGDEKQSIYSFQGARPELLREETRRYLGLIESGGAVAREVPLRTSYRSTAQVLAFVDAVFEAGVPPGDEAVRHEVGRAGQPGCVDLWPLVPEPEADSREAWDPVDATLRDAASKVLARQIALEIKDLVRRGDAVRERDGARPATWGDVLILVRRRGALFEEILRALKHHGVPVAGADRLALSGHIVFDDLMALAKIVLYPGDDLTLAALLKSPFCGWEDERLYALAHGRTGSLWAALQAAGGEAARFLAAMREAGRRLEPYEFYAAALGARAGDGRSMRAHVLRRLGAEAQDALDEFLTQVLAAERRGVRDLESLVHDFASLDIVVKRELEGGRDEVRVMTAHGAKGLEAPIVFLPETTVEGAGRPSPFLETLDGGFLWCSSGKNDCEGSAAARALRAKREGEESLRLLYVALTRARERLVLAGRLPTNRKAENLKGWWAAIQRGFEAVGEPCAERVMAGGEVTAKRYGTDPVCLTPHAATHAPGAVLPDWAAVNPPAEAFARYASPSDLGAGAVVAAPSPLAAAGGLGRFRRGDLIHRLLQLLPDLPPPERAAGAARLLAREPDLTDAQRAEMTAAALAVLADPAFAEVFGPGSRAEVAIAGTAAVLPAGLAISGRIDRLVVLPNRVLVVDFKTNRPSPDRIEAADPSYLRQMALYAAVLREVFPGRRIEAAIVWTDGPKLMPVPEILMARALAELGRGG